MSDDAAATGNVDEVAPSFDGSVPIVDEVIVVNNEAPIVDEVVVVSEEVPVVSVISPNVGEVNVEVPDVSVVDSNVDEVFDVRGPSPGDPDEEVAVECYLDVADDIDVRISVLVR